VTDDQGATGTATHPVTVTAPNAAPTASFTTSANDLGATFDGSASSDDSAIASYARTFVDGTSGTGVTASHTYAAAGSYPVTLTVTDDQGGHRNRDPLGHCDETRRVERAGS
jgi:PKD repeat protein